MQKKQILIIEDEAKVEQSLRDLLAGGYDLRVAKNEKEALSFLSKKKPALLIIDFDLKGKDGLQLYKEIKSPPKTIMLSSTGSIPLAVSAAKLGVAEFLRKPINAEQIFEAVEKNITDEFLQLRWTPRSEWLQGESPKIKALLDEIKKALAGSETIILQAEQGSAKGAVAEFIHLNSVQKARKLIRLDLRSFNKETLEPHFWATVKKITALPEGSSLPSEAERCGSLYLENLETLNEHFRLAVVDFFKLKKGNFDKNIRIIYGLYDPALIDAKDYAWVNIPPLRQRKEDLPYLISWYLKMLANQFNKKVKFVSAEALEFLTAYDYPGNYAELSRIIQLAVLNAPGASIDLEHLPVDVNGLLDTSLKQNLTKNLNLEEASRRFEDRLYHLLLKKTKDDRARVARFLDLPKSVLDARLEDLVD